MNLRHVPGELSGLKLGLLTVGFFVFGLAILGSLPIGVASEPNGDAVQRQLEQSHQAVLQIERRLERIEQQVSTDEDRIRQLELAVHEIRDAVDNLKAATTPKRPTR